jgi:uncharacterized RDD family membrane protein YckC
MNQMVQPAAAATPVRPCPSCGREWGVGMVCQFCNQVEGLPPGIRVSSPAKRFGGYLLEIVLFIVTLIIGYIIWSLIVWGKGTTPSKQILGMRVVKLREGERAGWGTMALRELVAKPVVSLGGYFTFGVLNLWLIWDKNNQELWDKVVNTVVVDDPHGQLAPDATTAAVGVTEPIGEIPPAPTRQSTEQEQVPAEARPEMPGQ